MAWKYVYESRRSDERTVAHWREPGNEAATKRRFPPGHWLQRKPSNMTALGINTVVYIRTILFQKKKF